MRVKLRRHIRLVRGCSADCLVCCFAGCLTCVESAGASTRVLPRGSIRREQALPTRQSAIQQTRQSALQPQGLRAAWPIHGRAADTSEMSRVPKNRSYRRADTVIIGRVEGKWASKNWRIGPAYIAMRTVPQVAWSPVA